MRDVTFKFDDFTRPVAKQLIRHGARLVSNGYLSAFNYVAANRDLPVERAIIHSLQGTNPQAAHVKSAIEQYGLDTIHAPCFSYYELDPRYTRVKTFKKEYNESKFYTRDLQELSIEDVMNNPEDKIVARIQTDLIVGLCDADAINNFVEYVSLADASGPNPWIHPALIVVEMRGKLKGIPKSFHRKPFFNLRKLKSEFYSVIYDEHRRRALTKYIKGLALKSNVLKDMLTTPATIIKCHVNNELNEYMQDNLVALKLIEP